MYFFKFVLLHCLVSFTLSENILFLLPIATKSHANVFEPLIKTLGNRGYNITVVTPFPNKKLTSLIHQINPLPSETVNKVVANPFENRKKGKLAGATSFINLENILKSCHQTYQNPEFQKILTQSYDLIFLNGFLNQCFAGAIEQIGAPHIILTTFASPSMITEYTGNYLPDSFVANPFLGFSHNMSFIERLINFSVNYMYKIVNYFYYEDLINSLIRTYVPNSRPYEEIQKNTSMIFMNSHFSLNYPRPNLPDNIEIGGMHCFPVDPKNTSIPKELNEFLSGSGDDGFIYFSLGSVVQSKDMPKEVRETFLRVFSKLKQRVIWKWDANEEEKDLNFSISKNVRQSSWLPQQDILAHPNIRLFITHGGLLSIQEAVFHGVQVLGIPLFADQDSNIKQAESQGYAVSLEILELNEKMLSDKIKMLLEDPIYSMNAKRLSNIFRDQESSPIDRAVYWTEYVIKHKGATHLRSNARNLNGFQVHSVDVISFLLLVIITSTLVLKILISTLLGFVLRLFRNSKRKVE